MKALLNFGLFILCSSCYAQWTQDSVRAIQCFRDFYNPENKAASELRHNLLDSCLQITRRHHKDSWQYDISRIRTEIITPQTSYDSSMMFLNRLDSIINLLYHEKITTEYYDYRKADMHLRKVNVQKTHHYYNEGINQVDSSEYYLNRDPDKIQFNTYHKICLTQKGLIYELLGQYHQSAQAYEQLILFEKELAQRENRSPSYHTSLGRLSDMLIATNDFAQAKRYLSEAFDYYKERFVANPTLKVSWAHHIHKIILNHAYIASYEDDGSELSYWLSEYENYGGNYSSYKAILLRAKKQKVDESINMLLQGLNKIDNQDLVGELSIRFRIMELLKQTKDCNLLSEQTGLFFERLESEWIKDPNTRANIRVLEITQKAIDQISNIPDCNLSNQADLTWLSSYFDEFSFEQLIQKDQLYLSKYYRRFYELGIKSSYAQNNSKKLWMHLDKSKGIVLSNAVANSKDTEQSSFNHIDNQVDYILSHHSSEDIELTYTIDVESNIRKVDESIQYDLSRLIKHSKITIIPDAVTSNISYGAHLRDTTDTSSFLEKDYVISYQLSASLWQEMVSKQVDSDGIGIIAPQFDQDPNDIYAQVRGYRGDSISLYHLLYAGEEVNSISSSLGEVDISYDKASLVNAIQSKRILHFAGHGVTFPNDSDNSFLALGSDIDDPSQKLTLRELYDLESNNELVVLSACSTAEGEIAEGEGVLSLARGFFYAGAKSVVSTLWAVNDQSSAIIMSEFYRQLKQGKRKDVALQQAKLYYLDSVDPEYQNPKYWAAFIVMGDMSPIFTPWWHYLSYGIIGFMVVMMIYLIGRRFLRT